MEFFRCVARVPTHYATVKNELVLALKPCFFGNSSNDTDKISLIGMTVSTFGPASLLQQNFMEIYYFTLRLRWIPTQVTFRKGRLVRYLFSRKPSNGTMEMNYLPTGEHVASWIKAVAQRSTMVDVRMIVSYKQLGLKNNKLSCRPYSLRFI